MATKNKPSPRALRDRRLSPRITVGEGRALRKKVPRKALAAWKPLARSRDPMALLIAADVGCIPELLPARYARMLESPFAFYRGAVAVMTADLARTPDTGLRVQACGDCHPENFGGFATPERRIIFDLTDFDETLPAPWEWDVRRFVAGCAIAARTNGNSEKRCREIAIAAARGYRERIIASSSETVLQAWYARIGLDALPSITGDPSLFEFARDDVRLARADVGAGSRESPRQQRKRLMEEFVDEPPLPDFFPPKRARVLRRSLAEALRCYRGALTGNRRVLLDRYQVAGLAIKVVGIGSFGTLCGIALLTAGARDSLLLQIKQARHSVLEPYAGPSRLPDPGQRVVAGQRLMQAASDLFLDACPGTRGDHFYVRQFDDAKLKPRLDRFSAKQMAEYVEACGGALANAHARSGAAAAIAGYLGKGERADRWLAEFAIAYADQNEADYAVLVKAVDTGKIKAAGGRPAPQGEHGR
jgi:uncharacterized protein (DUF2252 family)